MVKRENKDKEKNTTQKTQDWVTWTPLKTMGKPGKENALNNWSLKLNSTYQ